MPILKAVNSKASFHRAADYVSRKAALIDSINCRADYAEEEMDVTRNYYGKIGGRTYAHYVLSFPPNSGLSPEKCAEIAKEVVEANPNLQGHEVLIAIHDVENIHAHLIANSVRKTDGAKYHCTKPQYRAWIKAQQEICRKYGFKPVEKKEKDRGEFICNDRTKYETVKRAGRDADIVTVYQSICEARNIACSLEEFISELEKNGIKTEYKKTRAHIVFSFNNRKFRDSNISKTFSDRIIKEDLEHEFCNNRNRKDHDHRRKEIDREIEQRKRSVDCLVPGPYARNQKSGKGRKGRTRERY